MIPHGRCSDSRLVARATAAAGKRQLQEFQKRAGIETRLHASGKPAYLPDTTTVLLYVRQELLADVARHAQAQHVIGRLRQNRASIALDVRDDGRGITEADTCCNTTLGSLGIHERVQQLGGTFTIQGHDHKGTAALVSVPQAPKP